MEAILSRCIFVATYCPLSQLFLMQSLKELTQIINKESKTTTYKFALLRSVIESIHKYNHYCKHDSEHIRLPMGLLVMFWIKYYYPILAYKKHIPQINGNNRPLVFRNHLSPVISYYDRSLGFTEFYKHLQQGNIPCDIQDDVLELIKKINDTIVKNPMHYIGSAVDKQGEIFVYQKDKNYRRLKASELTLENIINACGSYTIPRSYYDAFMLLGSYINGENALLFQWIDFSFRQGVENDISRSEIYQVLQTEDEFARDTREIKDIFTNIHQQEAIKCVWSDKIITDDMHIDHIIPYSLWGNNDFWNLMPSKQKYNSKKSDKIPSTSLLKQRKDTIISYWQQVLDIAPERFKTEAIVALCGNTQPNNDNLLEICFDSLTDKCEFLIEQQGHESWEL